MKTLSLLVDSAEKLANDPKAPAALVDWASAVYDQLIDGEARVSVRHLRMLSVLADDYEQGLIGAGYMLSWEYNKLL